jgi:hypothetical protein
LPLAAFSQRDLDIAGRSKQTNITIFCNKNLNSNEIAAIVSPRIYALASLLTKDFEEGILFEEFECSEWLLLYFMGHLMNFLCYFNMNHDLLIR